MQISWMQVAKISIKHGKPRRFKEKKRTKFLCTSKFLPKLPATWKYLKDTFIVLESNFVFLMFQFFPLNLDGY